MAQRKQTLRDLAEGKVTAKEIARLKAKWTGPGKPLSFDGREDLIIPALQALAEFGKDCQTEAEALFAMRDMSVEAANTCLSKNPPSAEVMGLLLDLVEAKYASSRASESALKKSAKYLPAKKFVLTEWAKDKGGFASKAEFARVFAKRVLNEFDVNVTPGTIAISWLPKKGR